MKTSMQLSLPLRLSRQTVFRAIVLCLPQILGFAPSAFGGNGTSPTNPLNIFQNYFLTGDYVVAGWVEGAPDGSGFAPGAISIPDTLQPSQNGVPMTVPKGADIVGAYLYWATVEGNQSTLAGQQAFFNGYAIMGTILGNPNAPPSWSAGGCSGSSGGSKTMRTYRADVRPYLPLDTNPASSTFGATTANGTIPVRLADSGSNGNMAPFALGATLVVIYRVLSPTVPLNAIVLYDGAFAPSNQGPSFSQNMVGFYEPATSPVAKMTHIVANGQPNKIQRVYLNSTSQPLPSLYGALPPFPGVYGSWDNPTWLLSSYGYVKNTDRSETTSVVPSSSNKGCVSWGAVVLSTSVQDTDGDGLLDVWESNQGYTDAVSGQWVALPGANPNKKDIFVEVDYLNNLDGTGGPLLHSHLPKQAALDAVGTAFANHNVDVHFDLGPNNAYPGDPYVIPYPVSIPNPLPPGTLPPQARAGGKSISEGLALCTDTATLCAYPGQPAVGWKGGFESFKNSPTLGNFQPGRGKSYHYMLFGHSLGAPRSYWSTAGYALVDPAIPQLVSIVNSGKTATITLQSPQGVIKPGDCPNAAILGCGDASKNRVSITGALSQDALNASYSFSNVTATTVNNVTTTTFTVTTNGVANGMSSFANEPQLAVTYLGPTSTSGHSDFRGGGDSNVTLGLWGADDPGNCQPDPSESLQSGQVYCNNEVGTVDEQVGTLMHELGHTLSLTHGGTYYVDPNNPSVPTDELNCKPNYLSVMNYLFQVRGFADGGFDLSGQQLSILNEAYPELNEAAGIGTDAETGQTAAHLTRWYSSPNSLDIQLQNKTGGRYASAHCDGTPLLPNELPAVRVDGSVAAGGTFSAPLDWNNNFAPPDAVLQPGEDLNHNGIIGDSPFSGFDDWRNLNLQQIGARSSSFGASGGGLASKGGGLASKGGGIDNDGGGLASKGGGLASKGGGLASKGGGNDQDQETAASTADPPTSLTCEAAVNGVPGCVATSGSPKGSPKGCNKKVPLSWTSPGFGQIRSYTIWRAVGSFPTAADVLAHLGAFSVLATVTGAPPATSFIDSNVKSNTTYTYFVTDANLQGAQSGVSTPLVVTVK
jgi:hypothetical protein